MRLYLSALLLLLSMTSFGQKKDLDPVKWSFDSNQIGPDEYELIFMAKYEKPWVVYSIDNNGEGPVPTSINFTSKNIEVQGKAKEKGTRVEKEDKLFGVNVIKYEADQPYVIKQKIKLKDMSKPITGYVEFMTCNNDVCLPPKDVEFSFTFKVNSPTTKSSSEKIDIKKIKKF